MHSMWYYKMNSLRNKNEIFYKNINYNVDWYSNDNNYEVI